MGLSANNGRDRILHSGEGAISVIKWSLSGKFVVWANGAAASRSCARARSCRAATPTSAWSRIAHVDKPGRPQWEEMAGVWKPRAEWIDEARLEPDEGGARAAPPPANGNGTRAASLSKGAAAAALEAVARNGRVASKKKLERLVVGWGDAVWILQVKPESKSTGREPLRRSSRAVQPSYTSEFAMSFDDLANRHQFTL